MKMSLGGDYKSELQWVTNRGLFNIFKTSSCKIFLIECHWFFVTQNQFFSHLGQSHICKSTSYLVLTNTYIKSSSLQLLIFHKRCSLLLSSYQTDIAYLMFILLCKIKFCIRNKSHSYQQSPRHSLSSILASFTQIRPQNTEAVMLMEFEFSMRVCEDRGNAFF